MHLRSNNVDSALEIMKYACNKPKSKLKLKEEKSGSLVFNIRAWSLFIDLLESCGTFEETKSAYERVLDLKIATPETVLNFATFLQANNFFEESFRVYERAVRIFNLNGILPHCRCFLHASYISHCVFMYLLIFSIVLIIKVNAGNWIRAS